MENESQKIELEEGNKKRGLFISIGLHAVLLLLAILPLMTYQDPPPEKEGILINFGLPDQGSGNDAPQTQKSENTETVEKSAAEASKASEAKEKQESKANEEKPQEKMLTDETSEIKRQQAEEAKRISEAQKKAEAEAQRKAAAEAERKKQEKAFQESKSNFEKAFSGEGKGKTSKPGSQGDLKGDPNSNILEGMSTGKGKVGGGLSDRGVVYEPPIRDQSQKTGRVVMKVCVDKNGKVTKADYTLRGSTTTDSDLKRIAIKAAKGFKFTPGELDSQCGTITIDFKVE